MKESRTPFDHRPDPIVGVALRRLLTTRDDAGFVARVMAAVAAQPVLRTPLEVLAGWARPGIAAAVVAALLSGFAVGRRLVPAHERLDEAMVTDLTSSAASAAIASEEAPDGGVVFATFVEP